MKWAQEKDNKTFPMPCFNLFTVEEFIFTLSLFVEGATEKVLQFIMPHKLIFNKKFGFIKQNVFLNTTEKVQSNNILLVIEHLFCLPFQCCTL